MNYVVLIRVRNTKNDTECVVGVDNDSRSTGAYDLPSWLFAKRYGSDALRLIPPAIKPKAGCDQCLMVSEPAVVRVFTPATSR